MLIPNPILFGPTPAGGAVLPVTGDRGGLTGYIVLGIHGPSATVELHTDGAWGPLAYPHTLAPGEQLRLTRTDPSAVLTTLRLLAPVDDGLPPAGNPDPGSSFSVVTDIDGYQTIENAEVEIDPEGYQTISNGVVATADADGYETVERS